MKNKGFTLVELLAVIVVLAIVSLIGYSAVGNVIESSKESAAERNLENFEEALQEEYLVYQAENKINTNISAKELYDLTVENFSGTAPEYSEDLISFDENGKVSLQPNITINDLECIKQKDGSFKCSKNESICKSICCITKGTGEEFGDEITCGTESFYVLNSDDTKITMLAKYTVATASENYNAAKQDSDYSVAGCADEIYSYNNKYSNYLLENIGMNNDTEVSTPKASMLKCTLWTSGYGNCTDTSDWVYSVPYWIESPNCSKTWCNQSSVLTSGKIDYGTECFYGVRPMVTMLKSDLQ